MAICERLSAEIGPDECTLDLEYAQRVVNSVDISLDLWATLICGLTGNVRI